jgi:hypothetical protein
MLSALQIADSIIAVEAKSKNLFFRKQQLLKMLFRIL